MRKRDVRESKMSYSKKGTYGGSAKNSKDKRFRDPQRNKELCSEGDRSSRMGQGIMVLLHF